MYMNVDKFYESFLAILLEIINLRKSYVFAKSPLRKGFP